MADTPTISEVIMFLILLMFRILVLAIFSLLLVSLFYKRFRYGGSLRSMMNTIFNFGQYPLSIYRLSATLLLTLIIPIRFATYIPAELMSGFVNIYEFITSVIASLILIYIFYKIILIRLCWYTCAMG